MLVEQLSFFVVETELGDRAAAFRLHADDQEMGYLVDSSSHYILGVGVPALVASTIVL